ncbi:MAG: hypothetical protein AB1772_04870 [Candidatus Zixiibacteriota bacterium]
MADGEKISPGGSRITDQERYRYIGFEVFPGTPKDLFSNDAEKVRLVDAVRKRRESRDTLRDDCKLLEERVGSGERLVLAIASVIMLLALFLPWYSAYTVVADTPAAGVSTSQGGASQTSGTTGGVTATRPGQRANEEIITGHAARAKTHKVFTRLSGLGMFGSLGSVGGAVFSSGFILMLSGLLMLVFTLSCLAIPIMNLYSLFGLKGKPDDIAVMLKKNLRLNWIPLLLLLVVVILSFFGSSYGFDAERTFASLGGSYGIGAVFNTLSWGIFVALAASIVVAVKGIEI